MKVLQTLFDRFWIVKQEDKDLYYSIKDQVPKFKSFISEKLGYHLLVNQEVIKLEKLPGQAEPWMGIQEFCDPMEYAFLCLALIFLEDKGKEEQFVLSNMAEFIKSNFPGEEIVDWTLYKHRRFLIRMMKYIDQMGLIKVDDGNDQHFLHDIESEVLYESTGLSRYFVRNFSFNIMNFQSYHDFEKEDWQGIADDKGILRRQRVYRRLILSPVVYHQNFEDVDYDYIKKQRGYLEKDFETYFDYELQVFKNGAMIVLNPDQSSRDNFPNNKGISDVILLLNDFIRRKVDENELIPNQFDQVIISKAYFKQMIEQLANETKGGWSKELREMGSLELQEDILAFMKEYGMVLETAEEIYLMPLVGKVVGHYPKDYEIMEDTNE